MFNFLFDGKIGDILAPVVPSNQLFLAIQHFKNDQLVGLLSQTGYDGNRQIQGEYSAIHVACRYNNRYALDMLLARGTNIHLPDQSGNTPLHYAAKYGHLDLCKYLIEKGCQVAYKNKQQQSAYDVAESHLVRQYLLPLFLQADRQDGAPIPPPPMGMGMGMQQSHVQMQPAYNPAAVNPPMPVSQPQQSMYPPFPNFSSNQQLPTLSTSQPTATNPNINVPPMQIYTPAPYYSAPQQSKPAATGGATNRIIQPGSLQFLFHFLFINLLIFVSFTDGFHSSASDPVLQQKYGHIIERPSIAPPPTGPPAAFTNYNTPPTAAQPIYNRYVPYDANQITQPAYPPQQPGFQAPFQPSYPPVAAQVTPQPFYPQAAVSAPPPLPSPGRKSAQAGNSPVNFGSGPSSQESLQPSPATVSKLLGNKALLSDVDLSDNAATPMVRPVITSVPTRDEGDVIQASSNSSSVL